MVELTLAASVEKERIMTVRTSQVAQIIGDKSYQRRIAEALDAALERAKQAEAEEGVKTLDLASGRYIIFSDHHKGIRNGADDFRRCERAYNAALAYYFTAGHTLVVLGDVEELWEERPVPVLKTYEHTFELEACFHQEGRYLRFWGNHDDEWQYGDRVKGLLVPRYGGQELKVQECLRIKVMDGDQELGVLFLAHGHQGSAASDKWALVSKLIVRYIWRPIQRLIRFSFNTPATDWRLRERHNIAMYLWAEKQENLALIAGHTHRPVFKSLSHAGQIKEELDGLEAQFKASPDDQQLQDKVNALAAELEWVRAQGNQKPGVEGMKIVPMVNPCYFNTGCCSYFDGDVTGIEIADGEIRLVRWPDDQDEPKPQILTQAPLRDVFAAL
jgi:UDP-2,3-diacylglucosamine pyrophosphatase LpxH